MSSRHIAIVGGGFSGLALTLQLLEAGARVSLIDRSGRFGTGLAYSTPHPAHVLNVRAARMSASADAPGDFADWLANTRGQEAPHEWFAPRAAYGTYLQARLDAARQNASDRIAFVADDVLACAGNGTLTLARGGAFKADAVVLAWGNLPSRAPAPFDRDGWDGAVLHNPWDADALAALPADRDVLLIGTGLTMVDVVLSLTQGRRKGRLYALSRHGLAPRAHAEAPRGELAPVALPASLSEALHLLRRETRAGEARGEPWPWMLDRLRPQTSKYWQALPTETQKRFLRHARTWWDVHRHRTAPHVHARIIALQESGELTLLAGRIVAAKRDKEGVSVAWRPRGKRSEQKLSFGAIVNCTGPHHDLRESDEPLLRRLFAEGAVRPHPTGYGLDVSAEGNIIGADGKASSRLFALGPPTIGAYWETTAVPEIRVRAQALAQTLTQRK